MKQGHGEVISPILRTSCNGHQCCNVNTQEKKEEIYPRVKERLGGERFPGPLKVSKTLANMPCKVIPEERGRRAIVDAITKTCEKRNSK